CAVALVIEVQTKRLALQQRCGALISRDRAVLKAFAFARVLCDQWLAWLSQEQWPAFSRGTCGSTWRTAREHRERPTRAPSVLKIPVAELEHTGSRAGRWNGTATLVQLEREPILRVLEEANWLIAGPRGAAARPGMRRTTLQSLIKRLE